MSDAICGKCQEPWELFYLAHEGLYEHPGDHAPAALIEAHERLVTVELGRDDLVDEKQDHYKLGGQLLQLTVLKGEGCPSCWADPSRVITGEDAEEAALDALRHNLFDSAWDGDPAELF